VVPPYGYVGVTGSGDRLGRKKVIART